MIFHIDLSVGQWRDRAGYRALFCILVILVMVPILPSCGKEQMFTDKDRSEIEEVITAQSEAWNRGDLEGFMAGYARMPELVFTSGGEIQRSWDGTLARYQKRYGGDRSSMGTLVFDILEIRPLGSDGAVVLGTWKLTGRDKPAGGVFSLVFERRPEGWRIVHDHTSSWSAEKTAQEIGGTDSATPGEPGDSAAAE